MRHTLVKDPLSSILLKLLGLLGLKDTKINRSRLFTFLYNFIPAFVFAPYLFYVGLKNSISGLVVISILLFAVDGMHLIISMVNSKN